MLKILSIIIVTGEMEGGKGEKENPPISERVSKSLYGIYCPYGLSSYTSIITGKIIGRRSVFLNKNFPTSSRI